MQVEFIAYYDATTQKIRLKNFASMLKIVDSNSKPVKIYCGNALIVFYSKKNKQSAA